MAVKWHVVKTWHILSKWYTNWFSLPSYNKHEWERKESMEGNCDLKPIGSNQTKGGLLWQYYS